MAQFSLRLRENLARFTENAIKEDVNSLICSTSNLEVRISQTSDGSIEIGVSAFQEEWHQDLESIIDLIIADLIYAKKPILKSLISRETTGKSLSKPSIIINLDINLNTLIPSTALIDPAFYSFSNITRVINLFAHAQHIGFNGVNGITDVIEPKTAKWILMLANALKVNIPLQSLELSNLVNAEHMRILAQGLESNTYLESLILEVRDRSSKNIVSTLADVLKVNRGLKSLILKNNIIDDAEAFLFADALQANTTLSSLILRDNIFWQTEGKRAVVKALTTNKSLQELSLQIDSEVVGDLANALLSNTTLQTLRFGTDAIDHASAELFANAIKKNTGLQSLIFGNCEITGADLILIAQALQENKYLKYFDISGTTNLGEKEGKAFATTLLYNKTLGSLNVGGTNLGDEAAAEFAVSLKSNQSLHSLDLAATKIGDTGVIALAEGLKLNKTLLSLHLSYNEFGNDAALALANALKLNKTLQSLDLRNTEIGDQGILEIAKALKENTSLKSLNLKKCAMSSEGAQVLADIWYERQSSNTPIDIKCGFDLAKLAATKIALTPGGQNLNSPN
jgi:Ran GTPase-activating protein (RanGAP) involved in mRNA processing and transport